MKPGRRPRRVSAYSVNWLTTSTAPPTSARARFVRPSASSWIRSSTIRRASASAVASSSSGATPSSTSSPRPIAPTRSFATRTSARLTRWRSARTGVRSGNRAPCRRAAARRRARQTSASIVAASRAAENCSTRPGLGTARDQEVVVADAVRVQVAVRPEHHDRHVAALDRVAERAGEVARQLRKADHLVTGSGRHAAIPLVREPLVGQGPHQADLASLVATLREQRRPHDEHVRPQPAHQLRRLAVHAAVHVDLAAPRLVGKEVAGGEDLRLGHVAHERLATEARLHGHHHHDVQQLAIRLQRG